MKTIFAVAALTALAAGCSGSKPCYTANGEGSTTCLDDVANHVDAGVDAGADAGSDAGTQQATPWVPGIWGCATDPMGGPGGMDRHVCAVINAYQCAADHGGQGGYGGSPECNTFPIADSNADGGADDGTQETALYYWQTTCSLDAGAEAQMRGAGSLLRARGRFPHLDLPGELAGWGRRMTPCQAI